MDPYVSWLQKHGTPLFHGGCTWWRLYHRALVPAAVKPEPVHIAAQGANDLLRQSGALLLRYFTHTYQQPTQFWYIACNEYAIEKLSKKTRYYVRRGHQNCTVQRVDSPWLATHGYDCYLSAHDRYSHTHPVSRQVFQQELRTCAGGPFEFWAVLCEQQLATYCKCVVGGDYVAALVLKSHPAYLHLYPVYTLLDDLLTTYVGKDQKTVTYGFRSIAHDTNIQHFLEKFGFHHVYCDLNVVYRPPVQRFVSLIMPFKSLLDHIPSTNSSALLKGLLTQEQIRRSFL